ncbi:MAG: transcriptional repressor LexA [Ottowia sp.]|nr:transcriptional repressor LexA [Ottowia sp.]
MTAELPKLTPRQRQVLQLIERAIRRNGAPPTRAEIAAELGFKSANAAEEHLRALARKGAIDLLSGTARGIRLKGPTRARFPLRADTRALPGMEQLILPLVGRVAAGSPILAEEHITGTYTVARALFSRRPDYLLLVRGMSMQGIGIMDGDLLAVHRTSDVRNGQIVVARLDDEVTVKRLEQRRGQVTLRAENPDFADITVAAGESLVIEGLAVGLIRPDLAGRVDAHDAAQP